MIKLCYDVNDYRRQIGQVINDEDTVIELGCHTGNTSRVILENNVKLIAIDNFKNAIYWLLIWEEDITRTLFSRSFIYGHLPLNQNIPLSEIGDWWSFIIQYLKLMVIINLKTDFWIHIRTAVFRLRLKNLIYGLPCLKNDISFERVVLKESNKQHHF